MSSNGRRTSKYEVHQWLKSLYAAGIRTYFHADLPEHLKNVPYQRAAASMGMIIWTGNKQTAGGNSKEYMIPEDVMILKSNSTKLTRC
jgi:hypothetical protein